MPTELKPQLTTLHESGQTGLPMIQRGAQMATVGVANGEIADWFYDRMTDMAAIDAFREHCLEQAMPLQYRFRPGAVAINGRSQLPAFAHILAALSADDESDAGHSAVTPGAPLTAPAEGAR